MHVGGVVGLEDVALQTDHGDSGLHSLPHDGGEGGAFVGGDNKQIGLLPDEGLHLRHLFAVVLLGIADDEFEIGLSGDEFCEEGVLSGAVGFGVVGLAESDHELAFVRLAAGGRAGGQQQGRGAEGEENTEVHISGYSFRAAPPRRAR